MKKRLEKHNYKRLNDTPTKVLAIFSINNWESQLLRPLRQLGEVTHFSWPNIDEFYSTKEEWMLNRNRINQDLVKVYDELYSKNINLIVFIYASDFIVTEDTMSHFQNSNTIIISFCWDDLLYFKGSVKGQLVGVNLLSRMADINLTLSPEVIKRYNFYNSPCFFWSFIPKYTNSLPSISSKIKSNFYVLFIGSKYGIRAKFINKLIQKGIEVKCFGEGWQNGTISQTQMLKEIAEAPVTLGFSNVGFTRNITTIKGRDFEVPLYGGLYLTQVSAGLNLYYECGKEILTYSSFNDCVKRINWIKDHQSEADYIRNAGFKKAQENCTWDSRMKFLYNLIQDVTKYSI